MTPDVVPVGSAQSVSAIQISPSAMGGRHRLGRTAPCGGLKANAQPVARNTRSLGRSLAFQEI
jgi:hypothetical protein